MTRPLEQQAWLTMLSPSFWIWDTNYADSTAALQSTELTMWKFTKVSKKKTIKTYASQ